MTTNITIGIFKDLEEKLNREGIQLRQLQSYSPIPKGSINQDHPEGVLVNLTAFIKTDHSISDTPELPKEI